MIDPRDIGDRVAALPMDEPPSVETVLAARRIADDLEPAGDDAGSLLVATMRAVLHQAADRHILFVDAVPLVAAGAGLLASPESVRTPTALAGARYDLETLLPLPPEPDVPISSLRRPSVPDRDGDL